MPDAPRPPLVDSLDGASLWLPRWSLSHCIRAMASRNTLALNLGEHQRYNYFPVMPTCTIAWFMAGQADVLEPGPGGIGQGERWPLPHRICFSGPYNQPTASWNPGPVHFLTLSLLPDALALLTGIDPGRYLNRTVAAHEVLSPEWMAWCEAVLHERDDQQRVNLIEDHLDPLWQAVRPGGAPLSHLIEDWHHGLALRAATSGLGRSTRQIERRIKRWTGQPLRELRGLSRAEQVFFDTKQAHEAGTLSWADLANEAGFSDQSHFSRQTRRMTGFAPEELRRRITQDPAFWAYRLWGFTDPGETR